MSFCFGIQLILNFEGTCRGCSELRCALYYSYDFFHQVAGLEKTVGYKPFQTLGKGWTKFLKKLVLSLLYLLM